MPMKHWTLGNSTEEILGMIDDTQLGMCFDIGHAFIQNEIEGFLGNIDRIYNVHIHDNNGRRDEHLVLGKGAIDIPDVIRRLNGGYRGTIIIESNNLPEGVESRKYLKKLFIELGI
jgi:sugar phosphate isomerase/epimerase